MNYIYFHEKFEWIWQSLCIYALFVYEITQNGDGEKPKAFNAESRK